MSRVSLTTSEVEEVRVAIDGLSSSVVSVENSPAGVISVQSANSQQLNQNQVSVSIQGFTSSATAIITPSSPNLIEINSPGPQGPPGAPGSARPSSTALLSDLTSPTYYYYGIQFSDGTWRINRYSKSQLVNSYASQGNNSYTNLVSAWSVRNALIYQEVD